MENDLNANKEALKQKQKQPITQNLSSLLLKWGSDCSKAVNEKHKQCQAFSAFDFLSGLSDSD